MAYLVDSNVFVRLLHRTDPHHELMRAAVRTLWGQGETLYFTSQNLGEFWSVSTRPATSRGRLRFACRAGRPSRAVY